MEKYTEKEMNDMKKGLIYFALLGSHAYDLAGPESDDDYRGVYIGSKADVYGLNKREQFDKFEFADCQIYELRKFVKLASESNPNIIELLFIDRPVWATKYWKKLYFHRHDFLSRKAAYKFLGYAQGQLKRMKNHTKWINNPQPKEPPKQEDFIRKVYEEVVDTRKCNISHKSLAERLNCTICCSKNFVQIYDRDAYKGAHNKWKQYWNWKKNRNPERAKLEEKYGYDCKHAMHTIRLLHSMDEILRKGTLTVSRWEAGDMRYLRDIRKGKLSYDDLMKEAEDLIGNVENIPTSLPRRPNVQFLNKLMLDIYDEFWNSKEAIQCPNDLGF